MSYKIAVGSSDGIHIDLKFGEAERFLIYEVADNIALSEEREVPNGIESSNMNEEQCGASGCSERGCNGGRSRCGGSLDTVSKVSLISDCRCVVCKKIGFQAQKQFERKAISVFDVDCTIDEALKKITFYYGKIDRHESLKK